MPEAPNGRAAKRRPNTLTSGGSPSCNPEKENMKINDTLPIQPQSAGVKSKDDTGHPRVDFNSILKHTVAGTEQSDMAPKASAVSHPFAALPVHPLMTMTDPAQAVPLVERIDRFLDLLDDYRQKLADPRVTLRALQPVVDDIALAREGLAKEINGLGDGEQLREVLNRSLVTAATEVMRFNRGDYVD
jgi:hypothetical protein